MGAPKMALELQGCIFWLILLPKHEKQGEIQPGVFLGTVPMSCGLHECPFIFTVHQIFHLSICSEKHCLYRLEFLAHGCHRVAK